MKQYKIYLSQSLHFLRAFQRSTNFVYLSLAKIQSQSLHFLRAFQPKGFMRVVQSYTTTSQSLHFLRAFQLREIKEIDENEEYGRNPFIFLGHFNLEF